MKLARDLMSIEPVTVSVRHSISEIVDLFLEKKYRSLPVVDDDNYPIGMITEFELTKTYIFIHFNQSTNDNLGDHLEILEIPSILHEDSPIPEVVKAVGQSASNRVLIISPETNKLTGIISPRDVMKFLRGERQAKIQLRKDISHLEEKLEKIETEKERLEEQVHLYSTVYEDSPYMMHSVNKHGIITIANKKLHNFLGYEDGELIGKTMYDIYPKKHHPAADLGLKGLIHHGYHHTVFTQLITKDGWEKSVDITSSAVYDKKKQFVCTITISREINTEQMWKALQTVSSTKKKYGHR